MSGNLIPGGDFSPSGSVGTYSSNIVAPSILSGIVKEAALKLIRDNIFVPGLVVLNATIARLIP